MGQDTQSDEYRARKAETSRRWRLANPDKVREMKRRYYANNAEAQRTRGKIWRAANREAVAAKGLDWRIRNVNRVMWKDAEKRAKKFGLQFDLDVEDIAVPEVCPVLGIPLKYGVGKRTGASPSLDRLRPELGYVKGNVAVISWRANDLKRDATPDELRRVADWYEDATGKWLDKGELNA